MRPLADEEMKVLLEKLKRVIGMNVQKLIERGEENPHVFRLHRERVYYLSEKVLKASLHLPRKSLVSAGVLFGKFTHSKKFRLHITCLDYLARLATHKVWVKGTGEQSFLYGNHIVKAHLLRVTEETPANGGVVIMSSGGGADSSGDVALGFGTMAKSVGDCRQCGPETIVVYHQADTGEYLRDEAELF